MKTGKINYEGYGVSLAGYLDEKGFIGEIEVKQPNGSWEWTSGEHPRIDTVGLVEINFEDYL